MADISSASATVSKPAAAGPANFAPHEVQNAVASRDSVPQVVQNMPTLLLLVCPSNTRMTHRLRFDHSFGRSRVPRSRPVVPDQNPDEELDAAATTIQKTTSIPTPIQPTTTPARANP